MRTGETRDRGAGVPASGRALEAVLAGFLGLILLVCPLKFGFPVMVSSWVEGAGGWRVLADSPHWPLGWLFGLGGGVLVVWAAGVWSGAFRNPLAGPWPVWLPLVFFVITALGLFYTESPPRSWPVVGLCAVCTAVFYGALSVRDDRFWDWMWAGLLVGFCLTSLDAWGQVFGGLEGTRQYAVEVFGSPDKIPPGLWERLNAGRAFATFSVPNSLGGYLILVLPALLFFSVRLPVRGPIRAALAGFIVFLGLSSLVFSSSRGAILALVVALAWGFWLMPGRRGFIAGIGGLLLVMTLFSVASSAFKKSMGEMVVPARARSSPLSRAGKTCWRGMRLCVMLTAFDERPFQRPAG